MELDLRLVVSATGAEDALVTETIPAQPRSQGLTVKANAKANAVSGAGALFVAADGTQRSPSSITTVLQTLPNTPFALCAATCDRLSVGTGAIKVGAQVQVKDSVSEPICGWGSVSHGDCGTVTSLNGGTKCPVRVDFDSHKDWGCVSSELEPCGGGCSLFVMRGTTCELRGWTAADGVDVYIKTNEL